jgi:hypothetical protein
MKTQNDYSEAAGSPNFQNENMEVSSKQGTSSVVLNSNYLYRNERRSALLALRYLQKMLRHMSVSFRGLVSAVIFQNPRHQDSARTQGSSSLGRASSFRRRHRSGSVAEEDSPSIPTSNLQVWLKFVQAQRQSADLKIKGSIE